MTVRRMQALDVPAAELERMKQALSPRYGAELWDPEGLAVLVVRVPRDEPDLVNDLEGAVEYLAPGDVAQAKTTLFVGHQRSHIVPTPTLKALMEERTALDRQQADAARRTLKAGEHKVFQAPGDPRRVTRLALRLACAKVADVGEEHLAPFVAALGPLLHVAPLSQVRAVQLVADRDDVRLDADLFFQDLEERWHEERTRRSLAEALAAQQAAAQSKAQAQADAAAATAARGTTVPPPLPNLLARQPTPQPKARTAVAPLRHHASPPGWDASDAAPASPFSLPTPPADGMGEVFEIGDPLPLARGTASMNSPTLAPSASASHPPSTAPASTASPAGFLGGLAATPLPLAALEQRLKELGYATLLEPGRHGIGLAAERADGFPNRVIAFAPATLEPATVDRVLAVARTVNADQALIVCPSADAEARRRLIATKAKWLAPGEVAALTL